MSLYNWLLEFKTKEQLARELVALAKENAALKDRAETELFWMKVVERPAQPEAVCGACNGLGWVSRDADIGTEHECFCCGGSGIEVD